MGSRFSLPESRHEAFPGECRSVPDLLVVGRCRCCSLQKCRFRIVVPTETLMLGVKIVFLILKIRILYCKYRKSCASNPCFGVQFLLFGAENGVFMPEKSESRR